MISLIAMASSVSCSQCASALASWVKERLRGQERPGLQSLKRCRIHRHAQRQTHTLCFFITFHRPNQSPRSWHRRLILARLRRRHRARQTFVSSRSGPPQRPCQRKWQRCNGSSRRADSTTRCTLQARRLVSFFFTCNNPSFSPPTQLEL